MKMDRQKPKGVDNVPTESMSLLSETKALLRRFDLKARKGLAQHFLIDRGALRYIMAAAELKSTDTVVEVGPGLGVLTRELASHAGHVIAIELDSHLTDILREDLHSFRNVTIIKGDILEVDPEALMNEYAPDSSGYRVVANLPYYITSAVLRHFLTAKLKPELIVVMVQKEVARAIVAKPGDMSLLAVSVQFYGKPAVVKSVPAKSFYPAPEVDSAILKIELYPEPILPATEEASFFRLVRAGFSAARKQLVNSLAQGLQLPKSDVINLLGGAGIVQTRRAETLSLDEWAHLWQVYAGKAS
jgi:16S rRNA (adenine1518-N6/adenine1519-N6)-dimethyltransferase